MNTIIKRISVCVATKNRTDMLHQLLWSLIRQDYPHWDLVIVDDSDVPVQWDRTGVYPRLLNEIARTGRSIRIAQGPRNGRIGAAYQVGFKAAGGDNPLFLRVDDDSWLEPDYLAKLSQVMEGENVGACGGLFLHPGQEIETLRTGDERYRHGTVDALSDKVNLQWFRHESQDLIPVEHLTANILFSSRWLERIGGFESDLYRQHRDETQASWRLHVEGADLYVNPAATAWHLRGVNGGARGAHPDVYLDDHRRFMAQRKTMKPGIHMSLGHAIGDGLMATPMLGVMRLLNPGRDISLFAPWAESVVGDNPDVDAIAAHPLDAQRTVRLEGSVYGWASANKWEGHLAEAYCRMFDLPAPTDITPRLFLGDNARPEGLPDGPYLVIAPWSSAKTFDLYDASGNKNWPLDRWQAVVEAGRGAGLHVVQLRGSEEEPAIDGVDVDFCERPLREALSCIAHARLLVSVDTMAHHAAAAVGTPSVVLWGRSKVEHFGYRKDNIINIQGDCPGLTAQADHGAGGSDRTAVRTGAVDRPCVGGDQWAMDKEVCPIKGRPCMAGIAVETVLEAIETLLSRSHECRDHGAAA